jgi:hypothetical protein
MIEGRRRRLLGSLVLLAATAVSAPCQAGATDAEVQSRILYGKGERLADSGSWNDACPLFQAAHDLHGTGGTALRAADCYEKIGKYERALVLYQWIVDHRDLERNLERVALAEGRVAALQKQLGVAQPATLGPTGPTTGPTQGPPPKELPPPTGDHLPAYVTWGIGGFGLVLGGIFGGLALSDASTVKSECTPVHSPCSSPNGASDKNSAEIKAGISTGGFVLAAAGAVVGTILFFTASPPKQVAFKRTLGPRGLTLSF